MPNNSAFSADIYNTSAFINGIKKNFVEDVDEDTLISGTFGFMSAIFQEEISNTVRAAAEVANEPFPTKARYDTSIYSHAINTDILDINAVPASMQCRLGFLEKELLKNMSDDTFIIDRDSSFYIEDKEFHLEYDVILRRTIINTGGNNETVYTARYDFSKENILSNIESPYLDPPIIAKFSNDTYVWVTCILRQYTVNNLYKKIITNNPIDNKTVEFEYENQLAGFTIQAFEGDKVINLVPTPDGKPTGDTYYAYYEYLSSADIDSSEIRIKFDRTSYEPPLNSEVLIRIYTTLGAGGKFTYGQDYTLSTITSEEYIYHNIPVLLWPISDSVGGLDRKSVSELRKIVPKESLARGSITSIADLEGYFNRLDSEYMKTKFYQKVHNQIENTFSAFLLIKESNVIIPTNTINALTKDINYTQEYNGRYVVKPGQVLFYRNSSSRATYITHEQWEYWKTVDDYIFKIKTKEIALDDVPDAYKGDVQFSIDNNDNHFYYGSPFTMIINTEPHVYASYYLMIMDKKYPINYEFVNNNSVLQFIGSNIEWNRKYTEMIEDKYVYHACITLMQNISADMGVLKFSKPEDENDEPEIIENNLMIIAVIYNDNHEPVAYIPGYLVNYIDSIRKYKYQIDISTNDIINEDNYIRLTNVYLPGGDINGEVAQGDVFVNYESDMEIFVLCKFVDELGNLTTYGLGNNIGSIVPNLEEYSLLNSYTVKGVQFFTNYTHIVSSVISPLSDITVKVPDWDDKSDNDINAFGTNFGARDLAPNQNDRWVVSGRDIATGITHDLWLSDEECMVAKINRSPDTLLRYNSLGQLVRSLNYRDPDNKDGTWNIIVYGTSQYENAKGLYRFGDSTFIAINQEDIIEYYKFSYGLQNKAIYCDPTNMGANAEWPQIIDYVHYRLNGMKIEDGSSHPIRLKVPDDNGSLDYEEEFPESDDGKFISYTKRFYIKSMPVVKYTYINDEERISQFIAQLESRREYINSALNVIKDPLGIDLKFFNTYGPSKTFFLANGQPLGKTNIVLKFRVKLEPGADKHTKEYIIMAIKDYIENITQYDNTHLSLLIKYLNTQFKESAVYIDYEGFDEFGPEQKHINRIEKNSVDIVPEFINVSTNDDLTPDIEIELV